MIMLLNVRMLESTHKVFNNPDLVLVIDCGNNKKSYNTWITSISTLYPSIICSLNHKISFKDSEPECVVVLWGKQQHKHWCYLSFKCYQSILHPLSLPCDFLFVSPGCFSLLFLCVCVLSVCLSECGAPRLLSGYPPPAHLRLTQLCYGQVRSLLNFFMFVPLCLA